MRLVTSSPFVLGKYFKSHIVKENLGIFGITALSFSLPLDLNGNSDKLVKIQEQNFGVLSVSLGICYTFPYGLEGFISKELEFFFKV